MSHGNESSADGEGTNGGHPGARTTCGLATASLVLGILAMMCFTVFTGIPALILGILALGKIRKSQGALTGDGLAITGIVLGSVSILLIPVLAGFLVPTLLRGRGEAYKVQCINNLKQLYGAALSYSNKSGTRAFPFDPEGPLAALQAMIDSDPRGVHPKLFLCPEGEELPAELREDGTFQLSEETCSYEIVPKRTSNTTANQILMYDKTPHHTVRGDERGRMVLSTDGAVEFLREDEFQERLPRTPGKPLPPEEQ